MNLRLLFILMTSISLGMIFAGQYLLLSDELYFNALAEQLTFEQIQQTIHQTHHWAWLTYIILPIFKTIRVSIYL